MVRGGMKKTDKTGDGNIYLQNFMAQSFISCTNILVSTCLQTGAMIFTF